MNEVTGKTQGSESIQVGVMVFLIQTMIENAKHIMNQFLVKVLGVFHEGSSWVPILIALVFKAKCGEQAFGSSFSHCTKYLIFKCYLKYNIASEFYILLLQSSVNNDGYHKSYRRGLRAL